MVQAKALLQAGRAATAALMALVRTRAAQTVTLIAAAHGAIAPVAAAQTNKSPLRELQGVRDTTSLPRTAAAVAAQAGQQVSDAIREAQAAGTLERPNIVTVKNAEAVVGNVVLQNTGTPVNADSKSTAVANVAYSKALDAYASFALEGEYAAAFAVEKTANGIAVVVKDASKLPAIKGVITVVLKGSISGAGFSKNISVAVDNKPEEPNKEPVYTGPSSITALADGSFSQKVSISDEDGTATAKIATGPAGVTLTHGEGNEWTLAAAAGSIAPGSSATVVIEIKDDKGAKVTKTITLTGAKVDEHNNKPVFSEERIEVKASGIGSEIKIPAPSVTDKDNDIVEFALTNNSGLPLTIDPKTGAISGTASLPAGRYTVARSARDSKGNTATQEIVITVANTAATIANPDQSIAKADEGVLLSAFGISDKDGTTGVTVDAADADKVRIADGKVQPVAALQPGQTLRFTLVAADGTKLQASISLGNAAPVFTKAGPYTVSNGLRTVQVEANDPDSTTPVTYTLGEDAPAGVSINAETGVITLPMALPAQMKFNVTATDKDGKKTTAPVVINYVASATTISAPTTNTANSMDGTTSFDVTVADGDPLDIEAMKLEAKLDGATVKVTETGRTAKNVTYRVEVTNVAIGGGQLKLTTSTGATETVSITRPSVAPALKPGLPTSANVALGTGTTSIADVSQLFTVQSGNPATYTVEGTGLQATLSGNRLDISGMSTTKAGSLGSVTVTATNAAGQKTTYTLNYTRGNTAPTVVTGAPTAATLPVGTTELRWPISSLFSDPNGDTLKITVEGLPNGVTYTVESNELVVKGWNATAMLSSTITVRANDSQADATLAIAVSRGNTAPTVKPSAPASLAVALNSTSVSIACADVFTDANGDTLTCSASGLPAGATVAVTNGNVVISGISATAVLNAQITLGVSDGKGGTATHILALNRADSAPEVVANAPTTLSVALGQSTARLQLGSVFADKNGDAIAVTAVSGLNSGESVTLVNGEIVFSNMPESAAFSRTVVLKATANGKETTHTLSVNRANIAPTVQPGAPTSITVPVGTNSVDLLTADYATDANGDALTMTVSSGSTAITGGRRVTVPTTTGFSQPITLSFSDAQGGTVTHTVVLGRANSAPTVKPGAPTSYTVAEGTGTLQINCADIFTDVNLDTLTCSVPGATVNNGVISISVPTNTVFSQPFTITVHDGQGGTATHAATAVRNSVNSAPVISTAAGITLQPGDGTTTLAATDADGNPLTWDLVSSSLSQGTVIVQANGNVTFTGLGNAAGSRGSFTARVSDGQGGTATRTFTVEIANTATTLTPSTTTVNVAANNTGGSFTIIVADANGATAPTVASDSQITAGNVSITQQSGSGTSITYLVTVNGGVAMGETKTLKLENGGQSSTISFVRAAGDSSIELSSNSIAINNRAPGARVTEIALDTSSFNTDGVLYVSGALYSPEISVNGSTYVAAGSPLTVPAGTTKIYLRTTVSGYTDTTNATYNIASGTSGNTIGTVAMNLASRNAVTLSLAGVEATSNPADVDSTSLINLSQVHTLVVNVTYNGTDANGNPSMPDGLVSGTLTIWDENGTSYQQTYTPSLTHISGSQWRAAYTFTPQGPGTGVAFEMDYEMNIGGKLISGTLAGNY